MLDSLKKEVAKRKEEKEELRAKIEEQKRKIKKKREEREKSFLRKKIKFVDEKLTDHEKRKDAIELEEFVTQQKEVVNKARSERRKQGIKNNKGKIAVACGIAMALMIGGPMVGYKVYKLNVEERYDGAVVSIIAEDYEAAETSLSNLEYEDSKSLLSYVKVQENLKSYTGKSEDFYKDINNLSGVTNDEVTKQIGDVKNEADKAVQVQSSIDLINTDELLSVEKDSLNSIKNNIADIDERYRLLVDDENLSTAFTALEEIEKKTPAGKTIAAIFDIGSVRPDDSSKSKIDTARKLYDGLSDTEKESVVGYEVLKKAETKYGDLKTKKERVEASEAQKNKEEEEQAKAEEEERRARLNFIVYLTPTGAKYHFDGCRFLTTKARELTQGQAIREGYAPCGECSTWATRP